MTKLIPSQTASKTGLDATPDERKAIKFLIDHARKISPEVRIRFVQREQDSMGTILRVSLWTPKLDDQEDFNLHAIAHDLEEENDITLLPTQSSLIAKDKQLLRIKSFLPPNQIAVDVKEPPRFKNPFWTEGHERYRGVLLIGIPLAIIVTLFMMYGYFPIFKLAQETFPQIFGRDLITKKFERNIGSVRLTVNDSIREIDTELNLRESLKLTDEQVQALKNDKLLLEKARADLESK